MKTAGPLLYVIAGIVCVAPFMKGAFMPSTQLGLLLCVVILFTYFMANRNTADLRDLLAPLDYAVLSLAGLYLVATLWSVNHRQALQEGLKQLMYVGVYWVTSRSLAEPRNRQFWVGVLAAVPVLVAGASVVLAAGWIPYQSAAENFRISGPFQYPNTTAALLMFGIGLLLSLRVGAESLKQHLIYADGLFLSLGVFVFTYSRIAWVLLPVMVILELILLPKGKRLSAFLGLLLSSVAVGAAFVPVDRALRTNSTGLLPVWFLGGLVLVLVLEYLLYVVRSRSAVQWGLVGLFAVGIAAGAALLPTRATFFVQRLSSISAGDNSLLMRLWTYKDAMRAWLSVSPVLGLGGGGWSSVYLGYRSVNIVSKLVHSSLLETVTELGVLGAIGLLATWGLALWSLWRERRTSASPEQAAVSAGILAGLIGLLVHTLLDFDIWYSAFSLFLFAVYAYCRASGPVFARGEKKSRRVPAWLLPAASGVLTVVVALFWIGALAYAHGVTLVDQGQNDPAESSLRLAVSLDPLNPTYQVTLGDFLIQYGLGLGDSAKVVDGGQHLERGVQLDPHNPDYRLLHATYLRSVGQNQQSFEDLVSAVDLDPLTLTTYQRALQQGISYVVEARSKGHRAEAERALTQVKVLFDKMGESRQKQPSGVSKDWLLDTQSPQIDLCRAQYSALVGKSDEALKVLEPMAQAEAPKDGKEALLWTAALYRSTGKYTEAGRLEMKLKLADESLSAQEPQLIQALTQAAPAK